MVTFKNILDRVYTTLVTDYRLDNLKKMDEKVFYTFLSGFLINSIDMFNGCLTNLNYREEEFISVDSIGQKTTRKEYIFEENLSSKEVYILSLGVAIGWYKKCMDDVTQFELHLSSKDFKTFSEQANIQRRMERLILMEEDLDEKIGKYQLDKLDSLPFFGGK